MMVIASIRPADTLAGMWLAVLKMSSIASA
jgi:hypothetical protein